MKNTKNRYGFTLIELLAVIIILGVIMTIAIPNIVSTLDKNKRDSFIKDAKRAITSAEYTIRSETKYEYPDSNTAVIFPLRDLKNLDLDSSPFDTYYSLDDSFVAITKQKISGGTDSEYVYYVHLVSCVDEGCVKTDQDSRSQMRGINLTRSDKLDENGRYDLVVKGQEVVSNYLSDTSGSYEGIKYAFSQILKNNSITEIVIY